MRRHKYDHSQHSADHARGMEAVAALGPAALATEPQATPALANATEYMPCPVEHRRMLTERALVTRYDDTDDALVERWHRPEKPCWWKPGGEPCGCPDDVLLTDDHVGRSDSHYLRYKCSKCGKVWCGFLEG